MNTAADTLDLLRGWRAAGWLRALDLAFAEFLHGLDAQAPPSLLLAAALLAQLEGRGHSALPLQGLAQEAPPLLGWPAEAQAPLQAALATMPADAAAAQRAWGGTALLSTAPAVAQGPDAGSPLVLQTGRLYLRRYWRYEADIAAQLRQRVQAEAGSGHAPDEARALLAALFDLPEAAAAEPDWQAVACALALRARLTLITGGPGTGKTYTAARLLVLLQALHGGAQPLRVALAAPTGKAAARLRQSMVAALQGLVARAAASEASGAPAASSPPPAPPALQALPLAAWTAALPPARTLHALLGTRPGTRRFVHDAAQPLDVDLLFVDEASMVHLEMMAALLQALPAGARLVLLGDRDQLASVEAGAVMGELCAGAGPQAYDAATAAWVQAHSGQRLPPPVVADAGHSGGLAQQTVVLQRSRRFAGPIGQLATAVNRGEGAEALALLRAQTAQPGGGALALVPAADSAAIARLAVQGRAAAEAGVDTAGYAAALQALAQRPAETEAFEPWVRGLLTTFDRCRVLCALRSGPFGVAGLNAAIEAALVQQGVLKKGGEWYEGRPVMVTRNEPALGIFNGDIGLVLAPPGAANAANPQAPLRAWFLDGETLRSVAISRLADVETAYAMTVHKSQGSEFAHVLLVLPPEDNPVLTRELVYTGITRARSAFTLVAPEPARLVTAAARLTRRLSGLAEAVRGA
ncbi:exodeoxyribonuclease V subunit alpha [Rubrivivax rivuli]|uniref:RecBCD enzyme subunit RecD n=1 Tax=Rubrivivax rivuli TaxID=1862385 RepID=A0A437RIC7_9BURK|nr:exodeoxyribonuclease V subunit alpha [Rubrivivax rivuli]RVU46524.1 exodeoxyribonuclease V subunit alpha [Rubrivivax rivuli]